MCWIAHNQKVHKRKKAAPVFILYFHNNQIQTQLKQLTKTEIYFEAETVFIQSCRSLGL